MERRDCLSSSILITHLDGNLASCFGSLSSHAESDRISKISAVQRLVRYWWRSSSGTGYHLSPEELIPKEWYNKRGSSIEQPASSCAGASMMNNCGDFLEQPFVRTIVEVENVLAP